METEERLSMDLNRSAEIFMAALATAVAELRHSHGDKFHDDILEKVNTSQKQSPMTTNRR